MSISDRSHEDEPGLAPGERADLAQSRADGGHRREFVPALDMP
jgi:hypothetical protein